MADEEIIETPRLVLRPASGTKAGQVMSTLPAEGEAWASDFPGADTIALVSMFLLRTELNEMQSPFRPLPHRASQ